MGTKERISGFAATVNKTFKTNIAFSGKGAQQLNSPRFSSGILSVDLAIGGGWPFNKIVLLSGFESTGKSLLSLKAARSIADYDHVTKLHKDFVNPDQFEPGSALIIDVEGSFDSEWADKVADFSSFDHVVIRPETSEQAVDIITSALDENAFDLIILDSIAAMSPQKTLEQSIENQNIGLGARLNNEALRRWGAKFNKTSHDTHGATLMLINQIRDNIGVMFGCFHGDTRVSLWGGGHMSIKEIVDTKYEGPVISYNRDTGEFEPKKIVNWFNNGRVTGEGENKYIQIKTTGPGTKNGVQGFACTPNHILFRDTGEEVRAQDVRLGDNLLSYVDVGEMDDPVHHQVVFGSLLGDGSIYRGANYRTSVSSVLKIANSEQEEYVKWKVSLLPNLEMKDVSYKGKIIYRSKATASLYDYKKLFYNEGMGFRKIPSGVRLTPLMAAIWYMDDGCLTHKTHPIISMGRVKEDCQKEAAVGLVESLDPRLVGYIKVTGKRSVLRVTSPANKIFFDIIAPYVHPSMQYKLPEEFRGRFDESLFVIKEGITLRKQAVGVRVVEISEAGKRRYRSSDKYDLQIEDTSTYLVGGDTGIVVHNSPETLPGGKGQRFFSSITVRMGVSKIENGENVENSFGLYKGVVQKNKTFNAKQNFDFSMCIAEGEVVPVGTINNAELVRKAANRLGLITGNTGEYKFGDLTAKTQKEMTKLIESDERQFRKLWRNVVERETGYLDGKVSAIRTST